MSINNAFQYYEQMRKQQVHVNKILNPEVRVPRHQAYQPIKAKIQQTRVKQRIKQQTQIQRENIHIMKKLFEINKRKHSMLLQNKSVPSFSLPPIIHQKKPFCIPEHQQENNIIAQKLIKSKSSINVRNQLRQYNERQKLKKSISKYHTLDPSGSDIIDRQKYIAQLMMLKKMKIAQQTESRLREYIAGLGSASRISKLSKPVKERDYYTNR